MALPEDRTPDKPLTRPISRRRVSEEVGHTRPAPGRPSTALLAEPSTRTSLRDIACLVMRTRDEIRDSRPAVP